MGTLKVWDGTSWQTVSQQGPTGPSALPPGGTTGQALVKRTGGDYDVHWSGSMGTPSTGWSITAGYSADKTFNPQTTTLAELANVVGTLVDALKAYGVLAP